MTVQAKDLEDIDRLTKEVSRALSTTLNQWSVEQLEKGTSVVAMLSAKAKSVSIMLSCIMNEKLMRDGVPEAEREKITQGFFMRLHEEFSGKMEADWKWLASLHQGRVYRADMCKELVLKTFLKLGMVQVNSGIVTLTQTGKDIKPWMEKHGYM